MAASRPRSRSDPRPEAPRPEANSSLCWSRSMTDSPNFLLILTEEQRQARPC
jgi:hypothetical protein